MAKKDYSQLSKSIIDLVGGEENIITLYHCVTRLRFKLKNVDLASKNKDEISGLNGVLSVLEANGQFQVVVGSHVEDVFDCIMSKYKIKDARGAADGAGSSDSGDEEKTGGLLVRFFNTITAIFNPIITVLAGSGMLRALLVVLNNYNLIDSEGATFRVLSAAGNATFFFLPILLAISAARVFKTNQFIAACIMAALLEPNFTGLVTHNGVSVEMFGIQATLMGYSGTVIPAIISIFVYSKVERILKRFIPKIIEIFALPLLALLIMVPLTVIVLGPIGVILGESMGTAINFISQRNGLLAGIVVGGGWTILVMFGIHWAVVPIMINNIALQGYDTIRPMNAAATFAAAGVALGVFLRARNKETKSLAVASILPALLGGITEPIIYGLSVKYKKPLYAQLIAGAIGGGFMGMMGTKAYVYVFPNLTTLPAFFGDTFIYYVIGISMAFFISAGLTFVFGLGEEKTTSEELTEEKTTSEELTFEGDNFKVSLPLNGEVVPIEKVNDEVFASKAMGDGVGIIPSEGVLRAPFSGNVTAIFPTKHAIGLTSDSGIEMLVHIGIDTVELNGEHFEMNVKQGDRVQRGQILGTFEIGEITKKGYDTTTMVVFPEMKNKEMVVIECEKGFNYTGLLSN